MEKEERRGECTQRGKKVRRGSNFLLLKTILKPAMMGFIITGTVVALR